MPTTVFLRTAAASVALALSTLAMTTGAGAETASPPGAPTETGAVTPAAPPSAGSPATSPSPASPAPATTAAAPPAAAPSAATPSTTPPAPAAPDSAVANAATPQAPSTTAPVTAAPTPPVTSTPPAAPAANAAPATNAAPAAPSSSSGAQQPAATPPPSGTQPSEQAAQPPPAPPADPVVVATRAWLQASGSSVAKISKDDLDAATAFYDSRSGAPLWVDQSGFTAKAKAAMDEVRKADDWGLEASAFDLPTLAPGQTTPEALGEAEGKLSLQLLKYARFAKGGRVNPASLSRILDLKPPLKDPNAVLTELAQASEPDAYLRDLHPKHHQFQLLHKALLAARGPSKPEIEVDPALTVRLPASKSLLKLGIDAPEVALLRKRLKVPADAGVKETLFDEKVETALKVFQVDKQLKATGQLTGVTRNALNREVDALKPHDPGRNVQFIVMNMERWRWMPDDMGHVYVWNNIPEYMTRVIKDDKEIFKEKIIVGMPAWATPVFSADMQYVVFNPSWGMPDGIKQRELAPRLKAAGGGFLFFGGGGGGSIIRAYGLNVYRGNQQIDPDSVDWTTADLRNYSFVQPPGGKNPLGIVKFRFPNKYDVYMHDTIERPLFGQATRALSHGCIRVQDPRAFAAVVLAEGNGYSKEQAERVAAGGGEITLKKPIPTHMTYFTAVANEDGRISTFPDIYGHDSRLSAALMGKPFKSEPIINAPVPDDAVASDDGTPQGNQKKGKKKKYQAPDTLADAISGFWMN